jgi:hypothetical protein
MEYQDYRRMSIVRLVLLLALGCLAFLALGCLAFAARAAQVFVKSMRRAARALGGA